MHQNRKVTPREGKILFDGVGRPWIVIQQRQWEKLQEELTVRTL
jgi:hypothetical protein